MRAPTYQAKSNQAGAALLMLLTMIVLGGAYLLLTSLNGSSGKLLQNQQTVDALAQAKDALIGHALTYADQHAGQPQGYLPCPDLDGDGTADGACGAANESVIGRLPWRTLDLPPLRDGSGACLWYVVSGTYKNNPKLALTSDTDGMLLVENQAGATVIGVTPIKQAIAIVFAPGQLFAPQDRSFTRGTRTECGSTTPGDAGNNAANYLEALGDINNATGFDIAAAGLSSGSDPLPASLPSVFVNAAIVKDTEGNIVFNDALLAITPVDFSRVYHRMDEWVAARVVNCLQAYQSQATNNGKFPWTSAINPLGYNDAEGQLYGRVSNEIGAGNINNLDGFNDTLASDPAMTSAWINEPSPPLPQSNIRCFNDTIVADLNWEWWWWSAWKEMVFVGIDSDFAPNGTATLPAARLTLDGANEAAVVFISGRKLAGQSRDTNAEKANINNYLEADNAQTGDDAFISGPASNAFNDVVLPVTSVGGSGTGMGGGMGNGGTDMATGAMGR